MRAHERPTLQAIVLIEHEGEPQLRVIPEGFATLGVDGDRAGLPHSLPNLIFTHPHLECPVRDDLGHRWRAGGGARRSAASNETFEICGLHSQEPPYVDLIG